MYERSTIALIAKFAHEVLEVFYAIPTGFYSVTGDRYSGILLETGIPKQDRAA
ncbi:hypothetical protein B0H11DRAFT_2232944 [Mycena galericulata]|nr:hypothetical protein B0H11DRAFT_2232944 [Mycena galericulata]